MTKTVKIQLISKNDDIIHYTEINKILWQLQREMWTVANKCIQLCWEYNGFESEWKKQHGEYPTNEESRSILGKALTSVIYNRLRVEVPNVYSDNLNAIIQMAVGKFNSSKKDIMRGNISIPSFKKNLPIELNKKSIKLICEKDNNGGVVEWVFILSLLSRNGKKEYNLPTGQLTFKAIVPAKNAGSVRAILERCYDGVYSIAGSKLSYENGKWFILLCYSFDKKNTANDAEQLKNIMGVHIAEHNAVMCTFSHSKKVLTIDGGEVQSFTAQVERRRRNIGMATSKHSVLCGGGRVGHGYHTKMEPLEHISSKISNFRNTTNHRYSRQIVNWAIQNKCGTIQIEDLTGFATEEVLKYKLLRNWSYYDLINKIEYKAKECGIKVVRVGYKDLRKWCCNCQKPTLERVTGTENNEYDVCSCCGQSFNVDYNVPKALIVDGIDMLLKETIKGA